MGDRPHVVIIGGGFGGLYAARTLARAPVRVTLIDRRNHHLFQPLLYQVATAGLSAPEIAAPIRKILRDQKNVTVLMADATRVDVEAREVVITDSRVAYDHLIVAAGARNFYFGHDEWAAHAPGLKSIEDAFEVRRRVFGAFEAAERETNADARQAWLTFVVIGGGPTGVELAGALAEISRRTLQSEFRNIDPTTAKIILIEGSERVLGAFVPELSEKARTQLERLGVEVRTSAMVAAIDDGGVIIGEERLAARTVLWGAGIKGEPIGESLGAPVDRGGRVHVEPDLSIAGHPEVFVVGDLCHFEQGGKLVPGVAPAAMQQGRHAAQCILRLVDGKPTAPFVYVDKGSLATIGRSAAVADLGALKLSGYLAWVAWLFIHIVFLIGFRSRLVVMLDWAWAYWTYQRSARLILEAGQPARAERAIKAPREP